MFKTLLKEYMKIKGISQSELADLVGDSQQAISDFLLKDGNPQKKTREKYFLKLEGFREFYDQDGITSKKQETVNAMTEADKEDIIKGVVKKIMGELEPLFEIAQITALDVSRIKHNIKKIKNNS